MILADFESRSRANLNQVGGRLYAAHESTEVLCAVLHDTDTGETGLWLQGDPPPITPDDDLAFHNAVGFDRFIAKRVGWPEPRTLVDTSELARRAGLPGSLDALGTRWLGRPKDKVASRFTKSLSRPSRARKTKGQLPEITPDVLDRVVAYCASDVEIMVHGWPLLKPFLDEGVFGAWEADVSAVDRLVNDRGVGFDVELAKRLLECDATNQARVFEREARVLRWSVDAVRQVAGSPAQLAAMLGAPDAKAKTIEALLRDTSKPAWVHALCRARQALASIVAGKLRAGIAGVSPDNRLRDLLRYYGAHTGRWSGRRLQPHNFTRPTDEYEKWEDADVCRAADACLAGNDVSGDLLDVLMRATITASSGNRLVVRDFSGVEARWLAWTAGDRKALDVFASGRDPYKAAAATIFGVSYDDVTKVQRSAGKVAELACGYQGGPNALTRMAAGMGINLAAANVEAQDVVDGWRKLHAPIVKYWRRLNDAFLAAVEGRATRVAPYDFVPSDSGRDIAVFLPSGRPVIYNQVGVSRDGTWPDGRPKRSAYYVGTKNVREHVYGGLLAENLTQAGCRDLMAEALVKAEEAGLNPVLDVHDELVCDVPASAVAEAGEELDRCMLTLSEWAEGFPVGAAGHTGVRYRK